MASRRICCPNVVCVLCCVVAANVVTGGGARRLARSIKRPSAADARIGDAQLQGAHLLQLEEPRASEEEEERPEPSEGGEEAVEHVYDQVRNDTRALSRLDRIHTDLSKKFARDYQQVKDAFMPGYEGMTFNEVVLNCLTVFVGMGIIFVYVRYYYRTDRGDVGHIFDRVCQPSPSVDDHKDSPHELEPDIIIVFHHPENQVGDDDKPITHDSMSEALVGGDDAVPGSGLLHFELPRFRILAEEAKEQQRSASKGRTSVRHLFSDIALAARHGMLTETLRHKFQQRGGDHRITWKDARLALLQDMYEDACALGWSASLFASVDNDEVYLALSLREWDDMERMLGQHQQRLHIQSSVVHSLGINQPVEEPESSPPLLDYDCRIVEKLRQTGIAWLESGDRRKFYRCYYDYLAKGHEGEICNSKDRVRLLFMTMSCEICLDAAERAGLIVSWYPVHNTRWIKELRDTWTDTKLWLDFSFVQPILALKEYYGSRVAFSAAWVGHWSKLLVPLTVCSVVSTICLAGSRFFLPSDHMDDIEGRLTPAFSLIVALWARVASNLWNREEQFFVTLFDQASGELEQTVRPTFRGEMQKANVDYNKMEKRPNVARDSWNRMLSGFVALLFCAIVLLCIVGWIEFFDGHLGIVTSAILSIQIVVFSLIFQLVCERLTELENHQFQQSYYNSYMWKQSVLNFVSNYAAFFYLSINQKLKSDSCPPGGCLFTLWKQIMMTLCILSFASIVKGMAHALFVRFLIWREIRQAQVRSPRACRLFWPEEQSKHPPYRLREQVTNDVELLVALGYPILFAPITFSIVPFCMIVFATRLRLSAMLLTSLYRRPIPRRQFDLSAINNSVMGLTRVGVVFSALTMVLYNPSFRGTGPLVRLSNIVVYVLFVEVAFLFIDMLVPSACEEANILKARRGYVTKNIMKRLAVSGERAGEEVKEDRRAARKSIDSEDWSRLPRMSERLAEARKEAAKREGGGVGAGVGAGAEVASGASDSPR